MAELATAIRDYLALDLQLTDPQPGALEFAVWDRWLAPKDAPGETPGAFVAGLKMKRNIVVLDGGDNPHPSPRPGRDWYLWDSIPQLYFFAAAGASGKVAIDAALRRVEQLLLPWHLTLSTGEQVTFELAGRLPLEDSEAFPGAVVTIARYRATGARRRPS